MIKRFIERPVLSTVVSIIILLLGLISLFYFTHHFVSRYCPTNRTGNSIYPGANAEVVASAVATPLEEAINGVENMTYMTSNFKQ